ncbi:hypothetical protein NUSPORA_02047 [Nucleospora cyclopteri]
MKRQNVQLWMTKREIEALLGLLKLRKNSNFSLQRVMEKVKKTPLQKRVLRELYTITQFPSTMTRNDLSLLIGILQRSIQVWFQNMRQTYKKNTSEQMKLVDTEPSDIPVEVLFNIIIRSKKY